ncbi:MAG: universal stress protein [Methanobacteriaceae archaeon]|nr:universal stress protein [Methanobacteriaceae archaeon]
MFQNILIPLNPSRNQEEQVIKAGVSVAKTYQSTVKLIYLGSSSEYNKEMEDFTKIFIDKGLKADYEFLEFRGSDEEIPVLIADYSKDFDLIIMGHRRFEKIYRFLHQSTAADLINLVNIPVMVIPDK